MERMNVKTLCGFAKVARVSQEITMARHGYARPGWVSLKGTRTRIFVETAWFDAEGLYPCYQADEPAPALWAHISATQLQKLGPEIKRHWTEVQGLEKFEGCHPSDHYFWEHSMDGCGDTLFDEYDRQWSIFYPDADDKAMWHELQNVFAVGIYERSDGFVCSVWYKTQAEWEAAEARLEETFVSCELPGCDAEDA